MIDEKNNDNELLRCFNQLSEVGQSVFLFNAGKIKIPECIFRNFIENRPDVIEDSQLCFMYAQKAEDNKCIDLAIELYIKADCLGKAAEIAENNNMKDKAIEIYKQRFEKEKNGFLDFAFDAAIKAGLYDLGIDLAVEKDCFEIAIKIAEHGNLSDRINELYTIQIRKQIEKKEFGIIPGLIEKWGLNENSKKLCDEVLAKTSDISDWRNFKGAAKIAEKMGLIEKSRELYVYYALNLDGSNEEIIECARLMKKFGEHEIEKKLCDSVINWHIREGEAHNLISAAKICEEFERHDEALKYYTNLIQLYEDKTEYGNAGIYAEKLGLHELAIKNYVKINFYDEAISVALKADLLERAIELCDEGLDYHSKAHPQQVFCYEKDNYINIDRSEINTLFEKLIETGEKGGISGAIKVFEDWLPKLDIKTGYKDKIIEIAKNARLYDKIVDLYCKDEDFDRALESAKTYGLSHRISEIGDYFMKKAEIQNKLEFAAIVAENVGSEKAAAYRTLCSLFEKKNQVK